LVTKISRREQIRRRDRSPSRRHGEEADHVMEPILVTGGGGTLGRAVVRRLFDLGQPVRGLTRQGSRPGPAAWFTVDLTTGAGLERAVEGTSAVIHCASDPRRPKHDVEGTARLIEVVRRGGVSHLVYISIVGVDRVPVGYYRAKLRVERLVEDSGLPWTILRATQFHDLVLGVLRRLARLPVLPGRAGSRCTWDAFLAERLAVAAAPAGVAW
jgi:uncharacterized protein YbjT (DUF2867 family)